MPDVFARDNEEDVLGNVGGVIAGALEMTPDQHQLERRRQRVRRVPHPVDEPSIDLVA